MESIVKFLRLKVSNLRYLALLPWLFFWAGCESMDVKPLPYDGNIGVVKIIDNPKVLVGDFVGVMETCFSEHGIRTRQVDEFYTPRANEYWLKYTALQSFDFVTYLSVADVWIYRNGELMAKGHWQLDWNGGITLSKFDGTETKMRPFFAELLKNYKKGKKL